MALANDSVTVTPGTGATIATHLVSGKEYQVIMVAKPDGNLDNSGEFYKACFPTQAVGASKFYLDLFNATGTGKTMLIHSIIIAVDNDIAVTGTLGIQIDLFRTTAVGTGGTAATSNGVVSTAATISQWDNAVALPAGVTARQAPTAGGTRGAWLGSRWVFTEETNAGAALASLGVEFIRHDATPIKVLENSGICINQGTVASVGNVYFEILFELV